MNEVEWMKEALALAEEAAAQDEVPVGAIVLHEGRIIGRGFNQREKLQSPIAHAEILALQEAARTLGSWRLNECTLVVTLEPCPMCLASCQQGRVKEVIYGTPDPKGGALSLGYRLNEDLRTNHRFTVRLLPTAACSEILKVFFARMRLGST
jgi:tRNA(adenine34) deaminase